MLRLEFPELKHKSLYEVMYDEWNAESLSTKHPSGLFGYENRDFEKFVEKIQADVLGRKGFVSATLFFLVDTDLQKIVGGIQIRHHINHPNLIRVGGHIGYGIVPSERNKGYATLMLRLGLEEAKKLGLEKVLITCKLHNTFSAKVIEKNGGILESVEADEKDGAMFKRYWIQV